MTDNIYTIAGQLSPETVISVAEINRGANSRIYKVVTRSNSYALKRYPLPTANDTRNRLHTETVALQYMRRNRISNIPAVIATSPEQSFSLLSWVEGDAFASVNDNDIYSFAEFLTRLSLISDSNAMKMDIPYASEACVRGSAILEHIQQRLCKLNEAASEHPALKQFLSELFLPYIDMATGKAKSFYLQNGASFHDEIDKELQVLIPSDFGSHNALRANDNIMFLDFEYFGWDDPVTSTANFILHPAMSLSDWQKQTFISLMEEVFTKRDQLYKKRLDALLPLYAARWAAIILGEFIPGRFAHRVQSGQYKPEDKQNILNIQLAKARALINAVLI